MIVNITVIEYRGAQAFEFKTAQETVIFETLSPYVFSEIALEMNIKLSENWADTLGAISVARHSENISGLRTRVQNDPLSIVFEADTPETLGSVFRDAVAVLNAADFKIGDVLKYETDLDIPVNIIAQELKLQG